MIASKTTYATQCQTVSNALADAANQCRDLAKTYFDRGYNSGATAIIDADVAALGLTAANVASFITLAQQLGNFFANGTVTEGDYQATLNKLRTDL